MALYGAAVKVKIWCHQSLFNVDTAGSSNRAEPLGLRCLAAIPHSGHARADNAWGAARAARRTEKQTLLLARTLAVAFLIEYTAKSGRTLSAVGVNSPSP